MFKLFKSGLAPDRWQAATSRNSCAVCSAFGGEKLLEPSEILQLWGAQIAALLGAAVQKLCLQSGFKPRSMLALDTRAAAGLTSSQRPTTLNSSSFLGLFGALWGCLFVWFFLPLL